MVDGAALLATALLRAPTRRLLVDERGTNLLDAGSPFYDVYETADGKYVSVGAIEPQFYASLLEAWVSRERSCRARWTRAHGPP